MRKLKNYLAALTAAVLVAGIAFAQSTIPGSIGDMVYNSLSLNNNLTVAGTSTLTGAVTAPAGVTGNVTGNLTGNITGQVVAATSSPRLIATGGYPAIISTSGTDSTPVVTETYVTEIYVPVNMTITGVALFNGSNVTGNVTVGLATAAGAPIAAAKSASTAGSGVDAYQLVPFAAPYAATGPARYYIQTQYDSGTARYNTHHVGVFGCTKQTTQVYGTLTSFTAPTTFTADICNMASLY